MGHGYFRHPAIAGDVVVFVSEDDLWSVPARGGRANRLTSNLGPVDRPHLSPDGEWLAFTGREEGHTEAYCMPASGGEARRLTYLGSDLVTVGWHSDGRSILFASNTGQPFQQCFHIHAVDREGGEPRRLPFGPCEAASFGPAGGVVIGRNSGDPARWKRYRGGTTGDLWVDPTGKGNFRRLLRIPGNRAWPMWIGDRTFFVSDHEGVGNLYSCRTSGKGLRRETSHQDFYSRYPATDGKRVVYHCGADLWLFDPAARSTARIPVAYGSPRVHRHRKFADPARHLEDWALDPAGSSLLVTTRGRAFAMGLWEGAVAPVGSAVEARYRLARWLPDGKRFVSVCDSGGEEAIVLLEEGKPSVALASGTKIGRPLDLVVAPVGDQVVFHNQRNEIFHLDCRRRRLRLIDRSPHERIGGCAWSPDGRWIAYGFWGTRRTSHIRVADARTGKTRPVTGPDFRDAMPSFDPDGKHIYFLSLRVLDPVYDSMFFDLGFPQAMRPHLVTLRKDVPSPFVPVQRPVVRPEASPGNKTGGRKKGPEPVSIDFDGIESRTVPFPLPARRYGTIQGLRGKVVYSHFPIEGSLGMDWFAQGEPPAKGTLEVYDFETGKAEAWHEGMSDLRVGPDHRTLAVRSGNRVRVVGADEKPKDAGDGKPSRETGWIDLARIRLPILPESEWGQMFREAWRLQRDQFWTADMSGVDWEEVYRRYLPLLERVGTRGELSDLIWEVQGELGTSHCYEFGGDHRPAPSYRQGFLGADFERGRDGMWRIARIVRGDPWDPDGDSPLRRPDVNAREGEILHEVDGRPAGDVSPRELLLHRAGQEISLVLGSDSKGRRTVVVRALGAETPARYRQWVESNRALVHERSRGQVGYVHIPDMGPHGYAEFHRYYLAEMDHDGLLLDLRFNAGGHVSSLLLEKLARRRIGFMLTRWNAVHPFPDESPSGPMVTLTNEFAGSDGDIFCHSFKLMGLGPLVGKRTWGGVIGVEPRHPLADGTITTQPEGAFWFQDVGWGVENHGTDPDIEVEIRPQDYAAGKDPQLKRAIAEVMRLLRAKPTRAPDLEVRPNKAVSRFPKA